MQDTEVPRPGCDQLTASQSNLNYQSVAHKLQLFSPRGGPFKSGSLLTHNRSDSKAATHCCCRKACRQHPFSVVESCQSSRLKKQHLNSLSIVFLMAQSCTPWGGFLHCAPCFSLACCLVNSRSILRAEPSAPNVTVFHLLQ